MFLAKAVVDAERPGFHVREDAMNRRQHNLGGHFSDEIIPVDGILVDGCIRPDTSMKGLSELEPAFDKRGVVTAGTSSPLTDGASALLLVSEKYADEHHLPKLAYIKSMAISGCQPEIMGIGPVSATKKALARAGLTIDDIDIIELNEAFAAHAKGHRPPA